MPIAPNTDAEFAAWLERHPDGFVANSDSKPHPGYLKLHRASCGTIRSPHRSNYAGRDYRKLCSAVRSELEEWARADVGGRLSPCGICKP